MNPIFAAALEIQRFCRDRAWPFCIIGGVAVGRWGEPRLTQDVDVSLLTGWGSERPFVDEILSGFAPRRRDSREFALRHRVLLVQSSSAVPIDIALAAMPFEERAIQRSSDYAIGGGESIVTCSAEDLGGPAGYEALLEAPHDPEHPEHDEYRLWVGGSFDPGCFDVAKVRSEDPARRLREVYDFA